MDWDVEPARVPRAVSGAAVLPTLLTIDSQDTRGQHNVIAELIRSGRITV